MSIRTVTCDAVEAEGFMTKRHAEAVLSVCQSNKMIVTCRNTGLDSLARLNLGNPAKGHDILAKSIKGGSLKNLVKNPERRGELTKSLGGVPGVAGVFGLVGSWVRTPDGGEEPVGVIAVDREKGKLKDGGKVYPIAGLSEEQKLLVYTGDYDMHDLLFAGGGGGKRHGAPIPSESPDQWRAIRLCNRAMLAADTKRSALAQTWGHLDGALCENWHNPYSPLRHGPQRSYWGFVLSDPDEKDIIMAVLGYDVPIAVLHSSGSVYILDTVLDIKEFYAANGNYAANIWDAKPPEAWEKYGHWLLCRWQALRGKFTDKFAAWLSFTRDKQMQDIAKKVMSRSSLGKEPPAGPDFTEEKTSMAKQWRTLNSQDFRNAG